MKVAVFNDSRIGVVQNDKIIDVTDTCPYYASTWPPTFMLSFIEHFDTLRPQIEELVEEQAVTVPLNQAILHPPIPIPTKILAAPVNYRLHQEEMTVKGAVYEGMALHTIEQYGVFLKPPSSLIGSGGRVELPFPDRRTDHEGEVGVVIGKKDVISRETRLRIISLATSA